MKCNDMLPIIRQAVIAAVLFRAMLFTAQSQPLMSPPRLFLGGTFGYLSAYQDDFFSAQTPDLQRATFDPAIGTSFYAGLSGKYIAGYSTRTTVLATISYNRLPGTFTASGPDLPAISHGSDTITVHTGRQATLSHDLVKLDLLIAQPILHIGKRGRVDFGITLGPSLAYVTHSSVEESIYMLETDPDVQFLPAAAPGIVTGNRIKVASGAPDGLRRLRVGLKGGAYMEFAPFNRYVIRPGVYFDLGLTNGARGSAWKSHTVQVGLDLMLPIVPHGESQGDDPLHPVDGEMRSR
ncbi:MAG: hypothetical protein JWQ98_1419 [Chlorobi bacterium]|nr:hypothetical protein [Chlorobiota bacterium]